MLENLRSKLFEYDHYTWTDCTYRTGNEEIQNVVEKWILSVTRFEERKKDTPGQNKAWGIGKASDKQRVYSGRETRGGEESHRKSDPSQKKNKGSAA